MAEVNNIEILLQDFFVKNNYKYVSHTVTNLTAPGDNFGSLMLAVDVKVQTKGNDEKILKMIAKKLPLSKFIRKVFQTDITMKRELEFYKTILPTLKEFIQSHTAKDLLDFFPYYYNGEAVFDSNSEIQEDAVIILENLKTLNFGTIEKTVGFDLETARHIVQKLAILHAVPIALKLEKPEIFKSVIMPYLSPIQKFNASSEEQQNDKESRLINVASESEKLSKYQERVAKGMKIGKNTFIQLSNTINEPFGTLIHTDLWVNNIMVNVQGEKIESRIVDFQMITYGSPANDLVFFLFSSVQKSVLQRNYDELLHAYHETFINTLRKLKCYTTPFTFEALLKEIDIVAREIEFFHLIVMTRPIYSNKDDLKNLKDGEDDFTGNNISGLQKKKIWFLIEEFVKRNWI